MIASEVNRSLIHFSAIVTAESGLRRVPRQARSRDRVRRVLETAEQLLIAEGASALTTTRLAQEAGISVGSLYQWFPDLDAVLRGLVERYTGEFEEIAARFAEDAVGQPVHDSATAVLELYAEAFRARPAFRALWFGGLRSEELRDVARGALRPMTEALASVLAAHHPAVPRDRIDTVSEMFVFVADALLRQAFRRDPDGDPALLAEAALLLQTYLDVRLARPRLPE
jgi:AcrR family transcriptional regulator